LVIADDALERRGGAGIDLVHRETSDGREIRRQTRTMHCKTRPAPDTGDLLSNRFGSGP
jgi:hypothetical protein